MKLLILSKNSKFDSVNKKLTFSLIFGQYLLSIRLKHPLPPSSPVKFMFTSYNTHSSIVERFFSLIPNFFCCLWLLYTELQIFPYNIIVTPIFTDHVVLSMLEWWVGSPKLWLIFFFLFLLLSFSQAVVSKMAVGTSFKTSPRIVRV